MPDRPEDKLQFEQADYGKEAKAAAQSCSACKGSLGAQYFLANSQVVCQACADNLNAQRNTGSPLGRFGIATVLGLVAGALGAGLYFGIAALTGYEFGLVAIVVGFAVGFAVRMGSGGRGGKPYQFLAVIITYAAIVCTYIPAIVAGFNAGAAEEHAQEVDPANIAKIVVTRDQTVLLNGNTTSIAALDAELERVSAVGGQAWYHREGMAEEAAGPAADQVAEVFVKHNLALITFADSGFSEREAWFDSVKRSSVSQILFIAAFLFAIAAAAPFFGLPENIIGVLIIAFAVYQAWRSNTRATLEIKGPLTIAELPRK
ncbi:MAG: hypothetical protein OEW68_10200 [Gammaproteobacteria bacterium]|nr:hypothetical protein [Gammaproteobacteria bacterium]MDH4315198.1 hypothetical protein [Gammaproteobacteria bacterium]